MVLRKLAVLAVGAMLLSSATLASAGVPDVGQSTAEMLNYGGTGTLSMYNLPNAGGREFAAAFVVGGGSADATITVTVRDGLGAPIENFPFEDIWLQEGLGMAGLGLAACGGNAVSDANTDVDGVTEFAVPLFAGGYYAEDPTLRPVEGLTGTTDVVINGDRLTSGDLALIMNSPDNNGDGFTNLSDGGGYTVDLFGAYNYRSDFNADGAINVQDAGVMSNALGASCP